MLNDRSNQSRVRMPLTFEPILFHVKQHFRWTIEHNLFHVKQHFVGRIRSFLLDRTWSESASAIVGVDISRICRRVDISFNFDMPTCRSNEARAQKMDLRSGIAASLNQEIHLTSPGLSVLATTARAAYPPR
jgi:hypothetical protein